MNRTRVPRVFKIWPDEGFELVQPIRNEDYEHTTFNGDSLIGIWTPIRVKRIREGKHKAHRRPSDLVKGGIGDLIITGKAKEQIGLILERYAELLPLECENGEYWTLNVTCLLDALDEANSVVLKAPDEDRILLIDKYSFKGEMLDTAFMFKIPQIRTGAFFVTDNFVDLIKASALTGLIFQQIWAPN